MSQTIYLDDVRLQFKVYRDLADKSIERISDRQFYETTGDDDNSIAILVKHMAGNMRSRWTDFLTTDGEKGDRQRDTEFEITTADTREELLRKWREGWELTLAAVETARSVDPDTTITIRQQPHSLVAAFDRQLTHYAYHVGQIVLLSKLFCGDSWESLSVPKDHSEKFNDEMRLRYKDDA